MLFNVIRLTREIQNRSYLWMIQTNKKINKNRPIIFQSDQNYLLYWLKSEN